MPWSRILRTLLTFFAGVGVGGYLFSASQPRSFLALSNCNPCYRPKDLAGLLTSAGIQRASGALPMVVKETNRCIAIEHPFPKTRFHFVVFPKRDIKNIADISVDDQEYVLDCLAVIRALVTENGLWNYRVITNGPGSQDVTYLHFHVVSKSGRAHGAGQPE
jgi:diadenosine tetraphosphate (Ap4A) HIT family hydrolase